MPDGNSVYDIRLKDYYVEGNPLTQAEFEQSHRILNRTLFLIGDLSFRDLFTLPISQVIQHISSNASDTDRLSLLEDSNSIETLQEDLRNLEAELLLLDADTQEESVQQPLSSAIGTLRLLGIQVPDFRENTAVKQQVVAQLLASSAAELTYRDLFERTRTELEQEFPGALQAVTAAQTVGVLGPPPNGKCCDGDGTCKPGAAANFCLPGSNGLCVLASTPCANLTDEIH